MDATAALNAALAGRYEIERELGRGGMATVYLARDVRHNRHVALKVLDPELGAVLGVDRFLSEIRVTANLQHPHLLPLFDSGAVDGLLYYVMPYIEGESLRGRLDREKQLPIDEALRITLAVLAALDYAHGHGVVHRDLKPENILLQHGEPVVADFGIALAVTNAGGARITQTGLSLGTPQYMSPEQATGDRLVDARSDIYSMGAVLFEMLAGEVPHTGATVQAVIAKVITERPRSLRILRDTVPEHIDAAVLKALAKLPADRWPSARSFAAALRGEGSVARTVQSRTFWRGAAVVIAVIVAGLAWRATRSAERSLDLQLARQLTFNGDVVGAAISPDGGWIAYVTDDCFGKTFTCTNTLQVREVDGTQSVKLVSWPRITSDLDWSPDGSTVAFTGSPDSSASALYLIPRLGGTPQRIPFSGSTSTFAPDGKLVLASGPPGRQSLLWIDPRTLTRTDSAALPTGFPTFSGLDITPDGQRIAAAVSTSADHLVLLDGRGRFLDSSASLLIRPTIRWDAQQRSVFVLTPAPGTGDNIRRVPVDGRKLRVDRTAVALGMVQDGADGFFDVARTGRLVIVAGPVQMQVLLLEIGQPGAWQNIENHTSWVWANAFSPDGSFIAGSATDNMGENVYLFPTNGGATRRVTSQNGIRDFPFWSADGRHLGYSRVTSAATEPAIVFIDADGGRERVVQQGEGLGLVGGWMGNDALVLSRPRTLSIVDTTGAVRRTVPVPDSLALVSEVSTDPVRGRVAWWSPAASAVVVADLASGRVVPVFKSRDPVVPVGWGSDGSMFAAASTGGAGKHDMTLVKLPPGGAALVKVASLPSEGCWLNSPSSLGMGIAIGGGGRLASCNVRVYRPDVWLADVGGKSGW